MRQTTQTKEQTHTRELRRWAWALMVCGVICAGAAGAQAQPPARPAVEPEPRGDEALTEGPTPADEGAALGEDGGEALLEEDAEGQSRVVTVEASRSDVLRREAASVRVVELEQARAESADLGEVLARVEGVGVRRGGGLGSTTRLTLNGLGGERVRFLVDGLPLELSGLGLGVANVPVNLVERVEVYRGVVPVMYGADALGGAVHLVTDAQVDASKASASYQVGSFGVHRLNGSAQALDDSGRWAVRMSGFVDAAENDYPVEVEVPDARGRLGVAEVERFHDAYRGYGAAVRVGAVRRPWARRLWLEGFGSATQKEIQHDAAMVVPYGEATTSTELVGGTARYAHTFGESLDVSLALGYTRRQRWFVDVGEQIYDWFGTPIRTRARPGEVGSAASDRSVWEHNVYGRWSAEWWLSGPHVVRVSVAPTGTQREGRELRVLNTQGFDPLRARRRLMRNVSGLEYGYLGEQVEVTTFAKSYLYAARADEPVETGETLNRDADAHHVGFGGAVRYGPWPWLYGKLSYERAARLPEPEELFGDAAFVLANLTLEPERSHNANAELTVDARELAWGDARASVNGFVRDTDALILALNQDLFLVHQNAYSARAQGVDVSGRWASPGAYAQVEASLGWMELRNTSTEGPFAAFEGDRIPNQPFTTASTGVRLGWPELIARGDRCVAGYDLRYTRSFARTWESLGAAGARVRVPAQTLHSALLGYRWGDASKLTATLEVQNLTDARAFDFYGVQRPGRSVFVKLTAETTQPRALDLSASAEAQE